MTNHQKEYEVTERAGPRVAGQVVAGRKSLMLTDAEAEYDLREGAIVPKGRTLPKGLAENPGTSLRRSKPKAAVVPPSAPADPLTPPASDAASKAV